MNIILVDDTPEHLELLTEFVSEIRPRATIQGLRNGLELVGHLQRQPVDLVMMDLMMPAISGFDLVRQIRASGQWSHLPIIAVSGLKQPNHKETLREAGFNDYIAKPYEFQDLVRVLDSHLPQ